MTESAPIAVVIPAYNAEQTLAHCLRSVLAQTVSPAEIIVVDDGSSDQTAAVARACSERIVVLQQENQGSAAARQLGTEYASSEYIAYLDADDWWPEAALGRYFDLLQEVEIHFLIADFPRALPQASEQDYLPRNSTFYPWFREYLQSHQAQCPYPHLFRLPAPMALAALLRGYPYFPSASLVRRTSVLEVGGWDRRFPRCQDLDLALRLARRYPLHFFDTVQAVVGINEGNKNVHGYVKKQTEGDLDVLRTHYAEHAKDPAYRRQVAKAIARKYYGLGDTCRLSNQPGAAYDAYRAALRWPGKRTRALARMILLSGKSHA